MRRERKNISSSSRLELLKSTIFFRITTNFLFFSLSTSLFVINLFSDYLFDLISDCRHFPHYLKILVHISNLLPQIPKIIFIFNLFLLSLSFPSLLYLIFLSNLFSNSWLWPLFWIIFTVLRFVFFLFKSYQFSSSFNSFLFFFSLLQFYLHWNLTGNEIRDSKKLIEILMVFCSKFLFLFHFLSLELTL